MSGYYVFCNHASQNQGISQNDSKKSPRNQCSHFTPSESIVQSAYICHEDQKLPVLIDLFTRSNPQRVIIFSSKKTKVKTLALYLKRAGFNVKEMHSDLDQPTREQVMRDFKNRHIDILVATDVVARGIDITDIGLIVNFDIPNDCEDYVHRIGRTARGTEGEGLAITFVGVKEQPKFKEIEEFLGKEIYKIPIDPSLGKTPSYEPEKQRVKSSDKKVNKKGKIRTYRKRNK